MQELYAPSHQIADSQVAGFWDVPHSSLSPGDTHWDKAEFLSVCVRVFGVNHVLESKVSVHFRGYK